MNVTELNLSSQGDTRISRFRRSCTVVATAALASCSGAPGVSVGSGPLAPPPPTLRQLEVEVFNELNSARGNPPGYAANLSPLLTRFTGTLLHRPGWPFPVKTVEGPSAVREAIAALRQQANVPRLALDGALSKAARDLANDQSRTGAVGHTASDGAAPVDRINRYGTWGVSYDENVDYGSVISGRDVLEDMIVDDGVPSRGHRINTFDASARVVGVGCAPHPKYGVVCVIDQTGSFTPR